MQRWLCQNGCTWPSGRWNYHWLKGANWQARRGDAEGRHRDSGKATSSKTRDQDCTLTAVGDDNDPRNA
jgi:hypothetical protein